MPGVDLDLKAGVFSLPFHAHGVPCRLLLKVVGAVVPFVVVYFAARRGASLAGMPCWYFKPTADTSVPIVVVFIFIEGALATNLVLLLDLHAC